MKLYRTPTGLIADNALEFRALPADFTLDDLFCAADPFRAAEDAFDRGSQTRHPAELCAPIQSQEVWAAGVTYQRSRVARVAESKDAGGGAFYDKVYEAARPELFFKATPHRVAEPGGVVCIRADSRWNVPEPELTLLINSSGEIQGYTIGNDMSSRSIEGENALYLPQAKIYEKCAGLGPCIYVTAAPFEGSSAIKLSIKRDGKEVFGGSITVSQMKRSLTELAGFLFRECDFPNGVFLMTGTCLVPPNDFTLHAGDVVEISIDGIGTLINTIAYHPKHK